MKMIMKMLKKIMFFTSLLLLCDCQPEVDIKELFFILNTDISPSEGGTISLNEGEYKFNTVKTIHAKPNDGWVFEIGRAHV